MRIALLFFALALTAQVYAQTGTINPQPAAPAELSVSWDGTTYDFGQIPQGTPATHTFVLTNKGGQPVKIASAKPSCSCTVPKYTAEAIPAGATGEVQATYNAAAPGFFSKSVTVMFEGQTAPVMLQIKGEVVGKQ